MYYGINKMPWGPEHAPSLQPHHGSELDSYYCYFFYFF